MFATVLAEYAPEGTDISHAIKMLLIHDLVEVYAGDTYLYDEEGNVLDEKSRRFTAQQLIDLSCNFDQCKFPKSEEEVLPPAELLADYHKRREALDAQIDNTLAKLQNLLGL